MYRTSALKAALAKIRLALARKQGLSCIFGDVGMGKSSLLSYLLAGYMADENNVISSLPSGDTASPFAFLKRISADFEVAPQRSRLAQMDAIEEFLTEKHGAGKTTIVMIDEAQLLSLDCLEAIRSLLNYETNTEKMTQVILSGQAGSSRPDDAEALPRLSLPHRGTGGHGAADRRGDRGHDRVSPRVLAGAEPIHCGGLPACSRTHRRRAPNHCSPASTRTTSP
jgi:AAA domain